MCSEGFSSCLVCVFWGVMDQREFGNKCEKEKHNEDERHLSASVMNNPFALVRGLAWPLWWPMQGSPTVAYTYRV